MKRIHSKDDIIKVGLDILISKGFNATGVEAVLKEANVPKGSFYNFFSSKEEFALAIIDRFTADRIMILRPIFNDESLHPIERIKRSFEAIIAIFENNDCSGGCLIGNLGLEMSDHFEKVRQRLEQSLQDWTRMLSELLFQAQKGNSISTNINAKMLAENLIASFQGALLLSKVKKSSEPVRNFVHLYFDVFLAQRERI